MTTVFVPFHQDDRLDEHTITVPGSPEVVEPGLRGEDEWTRLRGLYEAVAESVAAAARHGRPAVVTGDCLASLGTMTGLQRASHDPGIVWFDAHGDAHTLASSTSGYLGGLPLRMLVGGDPDRLTAPLGTAVLPEHRALLVDGRDLDPAEEDYLAGSGIGRAEVASVSPEDLPEGEYLVHVDLDVVDAEELPGMRFPAAHGPALDEVVEAAGRMLRSERAVALEISCPWHPAADVQVRRRRVEAIQRLLALV